MFTVDYAHNDYLQCLAEQGVVALAVMLLFFGRILFALLNRGLAVSEVSGRCLAIACIGSLAAIFLHSFVDFNLRIEANAFLLAWVAGIASTFLPAESKGASFRVVASSAT
jgi:O-antigen ligase